MNVNVGKRSLALGVAAGVTGAATVATLAFASHASTPARTVQPLTPAAAVMPAMAAMAAPSAQPRANTHSVALTAAQARVVAERATSGRAERVTSALMATGRSYSVWVDRANGTEAKLIIDARTGRVLSTVVEPQDSSDVSEPQDSSDLSDQGSADPETTPPPDSQDSASD
ncbi:MAG: hypothetical protein QOI26_163 [Pseudonocardiales bacterium]|nr:hypothetical protein [Pseudonocardiales bacterium]